MRNATDPILFLGLMILLALGPGTPSPAADPVSAPTPADLERQAARCRELLRRSVLDFYLPGCVDVVNGGYWEDWKDGRFTPRGEKFLTLQARQLWFFSVMAQENVERAKCLEAARIGYLFLDRFFRDARAGGYISKTDDAGNPVDTRKHVYHNAFVIYGLVAYHQATREQIALNRAQDLFRVLEQRAHDSRFGGYGEFFHLDWRPVTQPGESTYVGAIGTKTYNSHLHLLEAFAALRRVWADPGVHLRLQELVTINTTTVQDTVHRCNLDGWLPDWRKVDLPRNLRASYGHDVECLWLVLDAARALGQPESLYRGWAESLAGYSLRHGFDSDRGGFYYAGDLGEDADDRRKEWWVQAEALVGMLEMFRLTRETRYYEAFVRTLDFIEKHQVAADGGWWATRSADGSPTGNLSRSSMWQGAYHNGRALLLSSKLLSNLKSSRN